MFYEAFCKTEIDPEGITWIVGKTIQDMTTAKQKPQQHIQGYFGSMCNNNLKASEQTEYHNIPKIVEY